MVALVALVWLTLCSTHLECCSIGLSSPQPVAVALKTADTAPHDSAGDIEAHAAAAGTSENCMDNEEYKHQDTVDTEEENSVDRDAEDSHVMVGRRDY